LYETALVTTDPFFANQSPYFYSVMVPSGAVTTIPGVLSEPIQFGDILLHGVDVAETAVSGQPLTVTLTWQTLTPQQRPLTAFVHLLQPDAGSASLVAQHDGIPCSDTEPVSHWRTNELILDEHIVDLPVEMENGRYLIGVGLYDTETFERLPVVDNEVDIRFGEAIIGAIDIQP
ncbi:MAG: hypothetical protein KC419_24230, partial [Anaerolineales bacterium]|nr:hypothetical protein [Anaerolineales bacterium]